MASGGGVFEVRAPQPHELDAFVECIEVAFAIRFAATARERFFDWIDTERALACFDGGELVATLCATRRTLCFPGGAADEVTALSNVAVLPTHRRRGLLTTLVSAALDEARQRGEWAAVLHASDAALYGRFGFAPATWSARFELDAETAALLAVPEADKGALRLLRPVEARSALPAIFAAAFGSRPGELARSEAHWDEFFEDDVPGAPERHYAVYEHDGELDGYVVYEVGPAAASDVRPITVVELYALGATPTRALWELVLGLERRSLVQTGERPVDDSLRHLLSDPRALRVLEVRDGLWLRLVDVAVALAARRLAGPGALVLAIADERCPWNAGRHLVQGDAAGRPSVRATGAAPDLALGIDALAACYLGGSSFATLARAGRVVEHRPGALAQADALFAAPVAPFAGDRA